MFQSDMPGHIMLAHALGSKGVFVASSGLEQQRLAQTVSFRFCEESYPGETAYAFNLALSSRMAHMQKTSVDKKKILKWTFMLFIMALGANAFRLTHSRYLAQERHLDKPIPFTVTVREIIYGPDGMNSVIRDITFAVRSDGSRVDILERKQQIPGKLIDKDSKRTIYFASGTVVEINDFTGAKSTTVPKVKHAKLLGDPSSKCITSFDGIPLARQQDIISEEVVAGYRTVKFTSNNLTRWFALDHGCAMVKFREDWGGRGYSEKNLIALIPGEPAATLFSVPEDDMEMTPSERILGRGKSPSDCGNPHCAKSYRKADEQYKANRPKK
jgi:hypothetical protein